MRDMSRRRIRVLVSAIIAGVLALGIPMIAPSPATAAEVGIGGGSVIAITPDRAFAYVAVDPANGSNHNRIVKVNLSDLSYSTVATLTAYGQCGSDIRSLVVTPDGTTLYIGTYGCVWRLNVADNVVTSGLVGYTVAGLVATNTRVYASTRDNGKLYYTTKGSSWGDTWSDPGINGTWGVEAISPDGSTLYIATESTPAPLYAYNTTTWARSTAAADFRASALAMASDGSYILGSQGTTVRKLILTGASSGTVTSQAYTIWGADHLVIEPSGTYGYVGGKYNSHTITKFRTSDLGQVSQYIIGGTSDAPNGLAEPTTGSDMLLATLVDKLLIFPLVPSAPTLTTATPGDGSASIAFTAGSGGMSTISNYEYQVDGGAWTALSPADATTPVTIPGLTNGTQVSVALRTVAGSDVSVASNALTVTPRTTPSAPTSLVATPGNGNASVAFTAGADGGSAITNYEYRVNGGTWTALSPVATTSPVTVPGLTAQVSSTIELRAVNAAGSGAGSASTSVTPYGSAGAPTSLVATAGDSSASIAFTAGANGGATITNYEYRVDSGSWTALSPADATSPVTISGLTNGTSVALSLRAVTVAGAGAASTTVNVTPVTNASAPTGLVATYGNESASVAFTAGANGGAAITNYEYRVDSGNWTALSPVDTTSPVTIPGLTNGTQASIELRAVTSVGSGSASSAVTVTPMSTPSAPTSLVATPGNASASIAFSAGSNGGSAITNYEFRVDGGTWTALSPVDTTSPVTIPGLTPAQAASIELRALNTVGNGAVSSSVSVTAISPAAAPTALVATAGNASASIAFTPGADGGGPITNYEYRLDGTGAWTALSPAASVSPVSIPGLVNGTPVDIELRAITGAGPGAASSAVTVTPVAPATSFGGGYAASTTSASSGVTADSSVSEPTSAPRSPSLPAPVAVPQSVSVGHGLVFVDGRAVGSKVTVTCGRTWQVAGDGFAVQFSPKSLRGAFDNSCTTIMGTTLDVSGKGFHPGTLVAVYLPGRVLAALGESRVKADGSFTIKASIPASMKSGRYVLQANGLASPSSVRSVNLGVRLEAAGPTGVRAKISFLPGTARVTPKSAAAIKRFIAAEGATTASAVVLPYVGTDVLRGRPALAHERAVAVARITKAAGLRLTPQEAGAVKLAADSKARTQTTLWLRPAPATSS